MGTGGVNKGKRNKVSPDQPQTVMCLPDKVTGMQ